MNHAERLRNVIERAAPQLRAMSDDVASAPVAEGKWSRKQILGHLIDSAANNHQRFVRVEPDGFKYDQNAWVSVQRYASAAWPSLIALWHEYNLHLAHVIEGLSGKTAKVLDALIADYVGHLEHHLAQMV